MLSRERVKTQEAQDKYSKTKNINPF